ncbi:hypothetical protein C450_09603 [Halococcus salifodinae DSM 8989]|uniref:Uncharacterized protein n=2 Tax=Halococcaceae TaxID=1963270 RepID=M0N6F8_9EURY|nr:hypothetical protein C450_09603 [Halococcus salifodinae DSM 8989]
MNDHEPGGEMTDTTERPYNGRARRTIATRAMRANAAQRSGNGRSDNSGDGIDSDGGADEDGSDGELTFKTYTDDEYGYQVTHPVDWTVEPEAPGGASFGARVGSAGAVVYVDEGLDLTLGEYVAAFIDGLAADEHVRAVEALDRRDIALESGETGRAVEYAYRNGMCDQRWQLAYLFVLDGTTGYTLGVDWNDDDRLEAVAVRIIESFALGAV